MASLRPFMPRASLALHSKQLQHRLSLIPRRAASTSPPKPRVLEQPDRFNPPSHPSRLRSRPRQYPGPPLSEHERKAQKTRRYPHMMPPKGTFMYGFLTNKMLHVWITMGILVSLVVGTWWIDFMQNAPDIELLPPNSMFFSHPFAFIRRYIDVYTLYVEHTSAVTAEMRRQKVEDVQKRAQYRKAHGLNENEGMFGWLSKSDEELAAEKTATMGPAEANNSPLADDGGQTTPAGIEGIGQQPPKKWFGIW